LQNRLKCKFNDAVFEALMQYFRVNDPADRDRLQKIDLVHMGILPDGMQFVRPEERWKVDQSLVSEAIAMNQQRLADQSSSFAQDYDEGTGEGETATRTMAKAQGVSPATVQRIWSARGLKPHLVKTFKLSNDPKFEEKLIDVVGLYLHPPDNAVVLCMDEKSSIQALDRTQASLPMVKGRAGTMTHDYKRNGTTTLFAALNVLTGVVLGQCLPRHRNGEFLTFLKAIDRQTPKGLDIHLILDNYATHKHPNVKAWLAKHPRFHLHFTPTSSSWLNLVERWFRDLTDKALRRGVFHSVPDLITAIEAYLQASNDEPKPFIWTTSADAILEKVRRGRVTLNRTTG